MSELPLWQSNPRQIIPLLLRLEEVPLLHWEVPLSTFVLVSSARSTGMIDCCWATKITTELGRASTSIAFALGR